MKKTIFSAVTLLGVFPLIAQTNDIMIDGTAYPVDTLIERQVGPGTLWRKLQLPSYPLNINMLEVDVTNPNVRLETTQANEKLFGTERLVDAAARQNHEGHRPVAGANGNFWCVTTSYPFSDYLVGTTFNANLRNGKIITETNCAADQWDRGPEYIGELGVTPEGKVYSNHFRWVGTVKSDKIGSENIEGANKLVRANEIVMFNSYYGSSNTMKCADQVWRDNLNRWGFDLVHEVATEVYLRILSGQNWSAGKDIVFEVAKIEDNTDMGTPDDYDLVLVGRDGRRDALRKLEVGDQVTLNYAWTTLDGVPIEFENMIGGNGQVMIDGELTELNTISENCALVYSKTGYGTSADHNKLFIIVIDKAGGSAGCTSAVMCQIAKHYGCSNLTNFDSGGSAMMLIGDKIVNTTTEGTPRAVANGMLVYATSPDDNEIARIEFSDRVIRVPTSATISPAILGYNKYGALVNENVEGVTFSSSSEIGKPGADKTRFVASSEAGIGELTATYNNLTVSKTIEVVESPFEFWIKDIVIDQTAEPIRLTSKVDDKTFTYRPENAEWNIEPVEGNENPIAVDSEGNLVALSEGKAKLKVTIGDREATADVSAELRPEKTEPLERGAINPQDWNITNTGTKNGVITSGGGDMAFDVDFEVSSLRGARIVLAKTIRLHSTPQYVYATVDAGDKELSSIIVTVNMANASQPVALTMEPVEGMANTYMAQLWEGERDLSVFPITFKQIQFTPAELGAHHISVKTIETGFAETDGVNEILRDDINDSGSDVMYDLRGIPVKSENVAPGVYLQRRSGKVTKILIK